MIIISLNFHIPLLNNCFKTRIKIEEYHLLGYNAV
jgi:hypothetical protein